MTYRQWVAHNPTAFAMTLAAVFVLTEAANVWLPESLGGASLLALLLVSSGLFVAVAVLFVVQARRALREDLSRARSGFADCLAQARGDFQRELGQVSQGIDASIESARQSLVGQLETRLDKLDRSIDSVRKDCRVIMEPDFENRDSSLCYEQLLPLIDNAQRSIFVVPNPYSAGKLDTWELPPRHGYLARIEQRVRAKRGDRNFEYLRVQQVPDLQGALLPHIGRSAAEHMVRLHRANDLGRREQVRFRLIQQEYISGQLIIDGETLVKFISGVDHQGNKRLVALSVIRDPHSTEVNDYYQRLRTNLLDGAVRLDVDVLDRELQQAA